MSHSTACYLYSLHPDFYTLEIIINIETLGNFFKFSWVRYISQDLTITKTSFKFSWVSYISRDLTILNTSLTLVGSVIVY
jgi:hypothetical protein